jgi:hypothetical protein
MREPGTNRLLDCELRLKSLSQQNVTLRELNTELLEALLAVKAEIMEPQVTEAAWIKVETAIAKAEKLK